MPDKAYLEIILPWHVFVRMTSSGAVHSGGLSLERGA